MGFHSFTFLYLFLLVSLAAYFLLSLVAKGKSRRAIKTLLLALSLVFYLWFEPIFFLPVMTLVLLNY